MKKLFKALLLAAVLCVSVLTFSITVSAETEDVELSTRLAKTTAGDWGQSVTYPRSTFNCGRINKDTTIEVEFELEGEWTGAGSPVELIFQNYSTADPAIWAKIEPFDSDLETYAKFRYDEMELYYGSDDFSTVDNMCLGDCGVAVKVTKFVVKNCDVVEVITTTTAAETESTTEATTAATEATQPATEATTTVSEGGGASSVPVIPIVIVTVVVAVVAVVIVVVLKNRRRFY